MDNQDGIKSIQRRDVFGNLFVGWNPELGVLTDAMGLPLSRTEAKALRVLINQHVGKSPEDISAIASKVVRRLYPTLEHQADLSPERFE